MSEEEVSALAGKIERSLMQLHGAPAISGTDLQKAMGYRSMDALRQAILRKKFPLPLFTLENRRGKFALVSDIARYLASNAVQKKEEN